MLPHEEVHRPFFCFSTWARVQPGTTENSPVCRGGERRERPRKCRVNETKRFLPLCRRPARSCRGPQNRASRAGVERQRSANIRFISTTPTRRTPAHVMLPCCGWCKTTEASEPHTPAPSSPAPPPERRSGHLVRPECRLFLCLSRASQIRPRRDRQSGTRQATAAPMNHRCSCTLPFSSALA